VGQGESASAAGSLKCKDRSGIDGPSHARFQQTDLQCRPQAALHRTLPKVQKLLTEARATHACNADLNASLVIKKRGVRAVLNNEVHIKIPKKVAFSKKSARRAGTVRSDASASKPAERVSAISAQKPVCSSSVKQETPLQLLRQFGGGRVLCYEAALGDGGIDPPESAYRCRFQTTSRCFSPKGYGGERLRKRHTRCVRYESRR